MMRRMLSICGWYFVSVASIGSPLVEDASQRSGPNDRPAQTPLRFQVAVWSVLSQQCIRAPRPATCRCEIKKHETEQHCVVALVEQREKAVRCVIDEIGECHLAGEDERGVTGEQAD